MIPKTIEFDKLSAGGNDFICLDNTQEQFAEILSVGCFSEIAKHLCNRGLGVGADGVILACERGTGQGIDIVARFMEPDGSEAELCGNGTACFTHWAIAKGLVNGPEVDILTAAGAATGTVNAINKDRVCVCVPNPFNLKFKKKLMVKGQNWEISSINTGVPHAITFVDNLDNLDVEHWGKAIRYHEQFAPRGINANFCQIISEGHIAIRTYEFGVEAETLACGTGSTAAAIMATLQFGWAKEFYRAERPVLVDVRGDETLEILFNAENPDKIYDVCMENRVRPIYHGLLASHQILELQQIISK